MNKLQLYITKSSTGFKSLLNFNPDEDVRLCVKDLRGMVEKLTYDASEKNIFYMISYIAGGAFVTVIRTIPPTPGAHLAAWIYIPNGLEISQDELTERVHLITRKVSLSGFTNEDTAELRQVWSKEYSTNRSEPAMVASAATDDYAMMYYGGVTGLRIADFLGEYLYQPQNTRFAGVVLLDADLGVAAPFTLLASDTMRRVVTLNPSENADSEFLPYVYGKMLNKPFKVALNEDLEIVWRRTGFEDIRQVMTITADGMTPTSPVTTDARKLITPSSFFISSRTTRLQLHNCQIRVNGEDITPQGISFTQEALQNAIVSVTCEGYVPYSAKMDLASTAQALIPMQERRRVYRFELPVVSSDLGAPIKFEVHVKEPLSESPIEGYELLDEIQEGATRTNHLGYAGGSHKQSWLVKGIYAALGLLVGVLICVGVSRCSQPADVSMSSAAIASGDSTAVQQTEAPAQDNATDATEQTAATEEQPAETPAAETQSTATNASVDEAVKYLDENKTWSRDEMEKYAALQGLFDDMNNMDRERLRDHWGPKLAASKNFALVAEAAKQSLIKKIPVKKDGHDPQYTNNGTEIGWRSYTYWIDRKIK